MYNKKDKISESYEKLIRTFHEIFLVTPYEKISIENIAKRAGMTRVNFYHYFVDKEDILYRTYIDFYRKMESESPTVDPKTLLANGRSLTYYALENTKANIQFYKMLFQNSIPASVTYRILDFITEESYRTHEPLRKLYKEKFPPYQFVNQYLAGAFWNLIRNLVLSGIDFDSELVSDFFTKLSTQGLPSFLDVGSQKQN
ncbi:transcriptional regulator, TetR family [Leptospira yanagawae serovar Saopaulo str. Sao Paulo = ATCC 700523]|uniref:Transcriptional regulator, TetR family n=1 Tax=Leptospira yanagawae serovar Saopaulo str. Sao Paulo = ATCC 700523 TaxID=1249483 RepID=A0A5E8HDH1_9LEPT|nr:TetR/AcrR family transcriptional regulator [Leptospira yanagawae]EOQ89289.1 transcriptional regulator, TetR family [Leptospira yanagawae serovar Saopaulo str. Sao Paulo = ATCC 700523]